MSGAVTSGDRAESSRSLAHESSPQGVAAMNGETLQRKVVIANPHGFHVRPAAAFAEMAGRFQCQVLVAKGDRKVDGKRVLELIMLAAEPDAEVVLEVSGPDAPLALEALTEILAAPEPPEPPLPKKG